MSSSSNASIWRCGAKLLTFHCPMAWDDLDKTASPNARHCSRCDETVYLCKTAEDFVEHSRQMHCVALVAEVDIPPTAEPSRPALGRTAPWSFDLTEVAKKFWMKVGQDFPELAPQLTKELERKRSRNAIAEDDSDGRYTTISFAAIGTAVKNEPGIYEIWTKTGVPLKGFSEQPSIFAQAVIKPMKNRRLSTVGREIPGGFPAFPASWTHLAQQGQ